MNQEQLRTTFEEKIFFAHFIRSIERDDTRPMALGINPEKSLTKAELCARDADGNYVRQDVSAMWFAWTLAYQTFSKYTASMGEAATTYLDSVAFNGSHTLPAQFRWADCFDHMLRADEPHGFAIGDLVQFSRGETLSFGRINAVEPKVVTADMVTIEGAPSGNLERNPETRISYLLHLKKLDQAAWDAALAAYPDLASMLSD